MTTLVSEVLSLLFGSAVHTIGAEHESYDLRNPASPLLFSKSSSRKSVKRLMQKGHTRIYRFAVIPSLKLPRWLLPIGDAGGTLAATEIYLPHKWLPRTIKTLLIGTLKMGWDGWMPKILVASRSVPPLEILVRAVTGEPHPVFALSLGRQPAVRKLTVQVMRPHGEILGYIKLPLTNAANERVRNEAAILEQLWKFPQLQAHIPRLLYAGRWNDTYMLFQSPLEGQAGPITFQGLHRRFLDNVWRAHTVEKSGYAVLDETASKWVRAARALPGKWSDLGQEVLRRSSRELEGKTLRCSVMHGDFAPWNTRVRDGRLLLFDWESACWEAPTSWDILHFHVQTASAFNKPQGLYSLSGSVSLEQTLFMLYLLHSVCQLLQEQNEHAISLRQRLLIRQLHGNQDSFTRSVSAA